MSDFIIKKGVLTRDNGNDENIVIPDSVTKIGASAFDEGTNVQRVTLPNGDFSICNDGFS